MRDASPATRSMLGRARRWFTRPAHLTVVVLYSSVSTVLVLSGMHAPHAIACALTGVLAMSFVEYAVHRWGFHALGQALGPRAYDFIHGAHHRKPWEVSRLPVPLTHSLLVTLALCLLALPFGAGGRVALGAGLYWYVFYELAHRLAHRRGKLPWALDALRRYHAQHHFGSEQRAFGVSTPLWDVVFGTLPRRGRAQAQRGA